MGEKKRLEAELVEIENEITELKDRKKEISERLLQIGIKEEINQEEGWGKELKKAGKKKTGTAV